VASFSFVSASVMALINLAYLECADRYGDGKFMLKWTLGTFSMVPCTFNTRKRSLD
jgi:hypothetical protein